MKSEAAPFRPPSSLCFAVAAGFSEVFAIVVVLMVGFPLAFALQVARLSAFLFPPP